ncbi:MAG TPA: hypothetical protein PKO15_16780 [Fibrobacteria bacterium]|nr:hypothetical protein [Fibrobacteria bacterium]
MREKMPLELLLREIAEDELAEAPARNEVVSQEDIGQIIARKRANTGKRTDEKPS